MSRIAILTDSSANLPEDYCKQHGVRVIPLKIHWGEDNYDDGVDITPGEFYNRLAGAAELPTTSQPPTKEFLGLYEELAAENDAIIAPLISSGISATVSSAQTAAAQFTQAPVEVIDSLLTASGLALLVRGIQRAVADGKSLEEVHGFRFKVTRLSSPNR